MRFTLLCVLMGAAVAPAAAQDTLSFNRDVRPILSEHCFSCHGPDAAHRQADLRLDIAESALAERDGVRAIVPFDSEASELVYRITAEDRFEIMPPADAHLPLSKDEIALLRRWVEEGAPYAGHWAFETPVKPSVPKTTGHPIDAFVDARLMEAGLSRSERAGREALIRRASLDLTGLPPTVAEVDAFLADDDPRAFERLVDELLTREQTAERLTLDWLDVARYADTNGYSIDDHREMWPWRDWVIRAFRDNKPYDEFLTWQLAGDLLPEATLDQKIATGFLRNAMNTHEGGTIPEEYRVASIVDKIDTVGTSLMGLTLECAQCHDHKYDPISQKDYYRFFALLNQTSEGGTGAVNGNTQPTLDLGEAWGGRDDVIRSYQRREEDLLAFLAELFADRRRALEQELLERASPAEEMPLPRGAHEIFAAAMPKWVWAPDVRDDDSLTVERAFHLESVPASAWLAISGDNRAELHLNGQRLGVVDPWMEPFAGDVAAHLLAGENVLRVEASNAGGVAGLLVALVDEGDTAILATDETWRFSRGNAANGLARGGEMKELGPYGAAPWGHFAASGASPEIRLPKLAAIPEVERSFEQWRPLLERLGKSLEEPERTLLHRQLGAIEGELKLVRERLKSRRATVMVLDSGKPRPTPMLDRGSYDRPGEVVEPGVPAFLEGPGQRPVTNRLELARWLTDAKHPLTARVAVNRYWQMLMGTGLVETAEDFGSQGSWPSHPELLDWLAVSFVEHGWNVRWLLKTIVLSEAYRQSSRVTAELRERDPYNRLLARSSRVRLPAEHVRDNALFIGGLLSMRVGGPSTYPDQPDGLWRQASHFGYPGFFSAQSFYPSVGEDRFRRSLYTFWKRTAPPPALTAFDAPNREVCTVRRPRTNTPLQALVTLNEPQFMEAARALGERMFQSEGGREVPDIVTAFRACTGRVPSDAERALLEEAYDRHLRRYLAEPAAAVALTRSEAGDDESRARLAAATLIASTLLNLDETITRP
ncbi:MAG: DUF1553 domain-containing protein [Planctomycetota bacterium]